MAAISSGVARPAVSSITETRYCIWDHLLWFGAPLVGGRSPCYEHLCPDPTASRASVARIPRPPARSEDLQRDPGGGRRAGHQATRGGRRRDGGQPRAPDEDRGGEGALVDLVDKGSGLVGGDDQPLPPATNTSASIRQRDG